MATEKSLPPFPQTTLTADGSSEGRVLIVSTLGLKVDQIVFLKSNSQPPLRAQVKRVVDETSADVGPVDGNPSTKLDISTFTTADSATIEAPEQPRQAISIEALMRAVYDEEPTMAIRTRLIDEYGRSIGQSPGLPLYIRLTDGSVNIGTVNAQLEVFLSHQDNDPHFGDRYDSLRLGDGVDELAINSDGSINVSVVQTSDPDLNGLQFEYGEVSAVASGIETTILTVSVLPSGQKRIQKIEVSGSNISEIRIKLDGTTFSKKRLWHGNFNVTFDLEQFLNGLKLAPGNILTVTGLHMRPDVGDFEATAYYL